MRMPFSGGEGRSFVDHDPSALCGMSGDLPSYPSTTQAFFFPIATMGSELKVGVQTGLSPSGTPNKTCAESRG